MTPTPAGIAGALSAAAKATLVWHVEAEQSCGNVGGWTYTEPLPEKLYTLGLAERERTRWSMKTRITDLGREVAQELQKRG